MIDTEIARPLELELQKLFGENSYQLERRPCTGKYREHTDYTLVFGSGRRLYIGLDKRNYLNGLWDKLRAMRHFGRTRLRTAGGSAMRLRSVTRHFAVRRRRSCPMTTRTT